MEEINFLSDSKGKKTKGGKKKEINSVKWSSPDEKIQETVSNAQKILKEKQPDIKEKISGIFSFLKRDAHLGSFDQSKLGRSREEILRLISEEEKKLALDNPDASAAKNKWSVFLDKIIVHKEKNISAEKKDLTSTKSENILVNPKETEESKKTAGIPAKIEDPVSEKIIEKQSPKINSIEKKQVTVISGQSLQSEAYKVNVLNKIIDWWKKREKESEKIRVMEKEGVVFTKNDYIKQESEKEAVLENKKKDDGQNAFLPKEIGVNNNGNIKKLGNSKILETNLIENEVISFFDWGKNSLILTLFVFVACMIVGTIYGGLSFKSNEKDIEIQAINNKVNELSEQMNKAKSEAVSYSALEKKADLIDKILDNHVYWTNFFKFLEEKTLSNITYSEFTGDVSGKFNLSARARSFNDLSEQLKVFKSEKDIVSDININGGKVSGAEVNKVAGVDFILGLTIKPELLTAKQ